MKKTVKIALKRFIILLLCLVMGFGLFAAVGGSNRTATIIIGSICLGLILIYWIWAIIIIRREDQKKKKKDGK